MSKAMDVLESKLMPIAGKVSSNRYLMSIRDGFMVAMPLLIIGAVFLLLAFLPITGYADFMASTFGANWNVPFMVPFNATMNIMTIFVILGIANSLSAHYDLEGISSAVIALVAFLIMTPFEVLYTPEGAKAAVTVGGVIPQEWVGSKGLFVGMLTAIFAVEVIRFVVKRGWTIKMPDGVPPTVSKAFSALIPAFVVSVVFVIVRMLFAATSFETIHNFIFKFLQTPLQNLGDTLPANLISNLFIQLFWCFGIHGANVVGSVMGPINTALSAENLAAFQAGVPVDQLPNIITGQFQELYVQMGGSGATLSLCLSMIFLGKSKQVKTLGRLALAPGLFNINEPITFGLPIVLNPIMMIPFVLTPLALSTVAYILTAINFAPRTSGVMVPWTTPPILGGFLIAGVRGALLQLVLMVVAFLIYYPFLRVVDTQYYEQEKAAEV
jgi:PTS system cellobiose-specific IIC component